MTGNQEHCNGGCVMNCGILRRILSLTFSIALYIYVCRVLS